MEKTTRYIFISVIVVMLSGYIFLMKRNAGFEKQISEVEVSK